MKLADIVTLNGQRSNALYIVIEEKPEGAIVHRVKKYVGFPMVAAKTSYIVRDDQVTIVDHSKFHDDWTVEQFKDERRRVLNEKYLGTTVNGNPTHGSLPRATVNDIIGMPQNLREEFDAVFCGLSPENLTCDGELRGSAVTRRRNALLSRKFSAEKKFGKRVDEGVYWNAHMKENYTA